MTTYPSFLAHSRLGPRTMAMLLGVILLASLVCASLARNLMRYLRTRGWPPTLRRQDNISLLAQAEHVANAQEQSLALRGGNRSDVNLK